MLIADGAEPAEIMCIGSIRRQPLRRFHIPQVVRNRRVNGGIPYSRFLLFAGRLLHLAGQNPALKMPSVQSLTWRSSTGSLSALAVFPPFDVERAPFRTGRFSIDEDQLGVRLSLLLDHRDKLPFSAHLAILFKVC